MTTHGRTGLRREWIGSVADTVMRSLDVPVLMLRPFEPGQAAKADAVAFHRIMIPLDGSQRAESIIDIALALGEPDATYLLARIVAPVPVIPTFVDPYGVMPMAVDPDATALAVDEVNRYMQGMRDQMVSKGATSVEQEVRVSDMAAPALLEIAKTHRIDLIAIATQGRGASRLVLGSVADKLLRGSTMPPLVCRGPHT